MDYSKISKKKLIEEHRRVLDENARLAKRCGDLLRGIDDSNSESSKDVGKIIESARQWKDEAIELRDRVKKQKESIESNQSLIEGMQSEIVRLHRGIAWVAIKAGTE